MDALTAEAVACRAGKLANGARRSMTLRERLDVGGWPDRLLFGATARAATDDSSPENNRSERVTRVHSGIFLPWPHRP